MGQKRSASLVEDSDDLEPQVQPKSSKRTKSTASGSAPTGQDDDGNPYWELSGKRRIGVSQFKNLCLINVREYYEKDGKTLPGKKGISLSIDQYTALLKAVPAINAALRDLGQSVEDLDDSEQEAPAAAAKKAKKTKPAKSNIEATSDEDED